jgi:hypothetical protein
MMKAMSLGGTAVIEPEWSDRGTGPQTTFDVEGPFGTYRALEQQGIEPEQIKRIQETLKMRMLAAVSKVLGNQIKDIGHGGVANYPFFIINQY